MLKSNTIGELAKALAIVQSKLAPAKKDSQNPFFRSSYADLNSVWDSCRELLTSNGLSVVQTNQITLDGVIVETILLHSSGEYIGGELFLPLTKQDAQGVGSALTYGRRYGLAAIVGIVSVRMTTAMRHRSNRRKNSSQNNRHNQTKSRSVNESKTSKKRLSSLAAKSNSPARTNRRKSISTVWLLNIIGSKNDTSTHLPLLRIDRRLRFIPGRVGGLPRHLRLR